MTNKEALKEIDRQEKRFATAKCGRGLRLAKSAREYYETMVALEQEAALALSEGVSVQDVDYSVLRRCLKSDGQVLEIEKENWSRE